jgi:hypothetical protein
MNVGWPASFERSPRGAVWLLALVLAAPAAGCKSTPALLGSSDAPITDYREVELTYDVSGQYRDIPLDTPLVQTASLESTGLAATGLQSTGAGPQSVGKPLERWTSAKLSIQFPHPEGKPDLARATLRLAGHLAKPAASKSASASTSGNGSSATMSNLPELFGSETGEDLSLPSARDDEIWVLDFPKQQLDLLLADLRRAGFFENQTRIDPGTRLEVNLEGNRIAKAWTPEPRLDDFLARVHEEGRLSGFAARATAQQSPVIATR